MKTPPSATQRPRFWRRLFGEKENSVCGPLIRKTKKNEKGLTCDRRQAR
jgi:hypothetical protein